VLGLPALAALRLSRQGIKTRRGWPCVLSHIGNNPLSTACQELFRANRQNKWSIKRIFIAGEKSGSIMRTLRGSRSYARRTPARGDRVLQPSAQRGGNEYDENQSKFTQEKYRNDVVQGAHIILPPFCRGALNLAVCSGVWRHSLVLSAGAQNFMNVF